MAARLGRLPAEKRRAALEVSASLAGVSLRASRAFVEEIPRAAKVLSAEDIRDWGEMGRRLAMGNAEMGADYFSRGVDGLSRIPKDARANLFRISTRQLVLSSSIAVETLEYIPELAREVDNDALLSETLRLAAEIANRSAKHSSDFLRSAARVAQTMTGFGPRAGDVE